MMDWLVPVGIFVGMAVLFSWLMVKGGSDDDD